MKMNLQALTLAARVARNGVINRVTKGTNTKTPVYDANEQRRLRERIAKTLPEWVTLWWDISVATGWRTADVCNLTYDCIDWNTGDVTITVAKQTKAAEARAVRKGIELVRAARKDAARLASDHVAYMVWDSATPDELAASMNDDERQKCFELVQSAAVKRDTKTLSPGLLKRLRERMERNLVDGFVFSRSQMAANRVQSLDGPVTRQTIWKRLSGVCAWFMGHVNNKLKLSAYSTRKIAAVNMMNQAKAKGVDGLLAASEMLGHSSTAITRTYLRLDSVVKELQREMVGALAA